jgi:hypothetical protein
MERCCGQAAMVHADYVNSWWRVELRIPLLKHTKYYYFLCKVHVSTDANMGEVLNRGNRSAPVKIMPGIRFCPISWDIRYGPKCWAWVGVYSLR